jgi:hypothetical protein
MSNYTIRPMKPGEIDHALEWAAAEGWNPGLHDGPAFYSTDPQGFLIGLLDGEPIACVSVVAYDNAFGFLGFYIVRPEFRGRGFGLKIWNAGMDYLGNRNVGLDGVPDQQDNYGKSGFALAYRNVRYEGRSSAAGGHQTQDVVALSPDDFPLVRAIDRTIFPATRDGFLRHWLSLADSHALGIRADDGLKGYGVIRKCRTGYKVGPLVAEEQDAAERLFFTLIGRVESGVPVFLDVPEVNPEAVKLAESHAMTQTFPTARMYNRGEPDIRLDRIFGVTTLELG